MYFGLTPEQAALRDGVAELLEGECSPTVVRAAADGDDAPATAVWRMLAEVGFPGAAVPETAGGLGLDVRSMIGLLEETGRAALPAPAVETAFVVAPLLAAHPGMREQVDALIEGRLLAACQLAAPADGATPGGGIGDVALMVPYAGVADLLVLGDGVQIRATPASGVASHPVSGIDPVRRLALVPASAWDGGEVLTTGREALLDAWDRGALGTAAQLIGLARRMLEMTVAYAKDRRQFGVPIGSFQAVKHHLAGALLAVEFAAPAVARAAWSVDVGDADRRRDVSMAKALASEAAEQVAAIALQCHGAIGYTVDYDLHLFMKRAWALAPTWGDAEWHRSRVAVALGL